MYILFTKRIETFWFRDVTNIGVLAHFELKNSFKIFELIKTSCAESS